ncbi:hypothetical protein [Streptococcus uberis]|uniref:hypothetical protein n=1 Tax=Streptococcus uberis TaxID=1349 RepID=UPI003D36290E
MSLFDEVKELGDESHAKWFERYFNKYNIEAKIKKSAMKGYTAYRINIEKEPDKYLAKRLGDKRTIDLLKNRLGEGFKVEISKTESIYTIFGNRIILDRFILISWG